MDNTARGYGYEYLTAMAILEESPNAWFPDDPRQQDLQSHRVEKLSHFTDTDWKQLAPAAQISAQRLPVADGPVYFVEECANYGEVYDIWYRDVTQKVVKVSCKTARIEDKAYRFNTVKNRLKTIDEYNRSIFPVLGTTYEQSIMDAGLTKQEYFTNVLKLMKLLVLEEDPTLLDLTRENFIGTGDYYKNDGRGDVFHYVGIPTDAVFAFSQVHEPFIKGTSVYYYVEADCGDTTYLYEIQFRVKFKDGVGKPVKKSADGSVGNIAGTISFKNLSIDQQVPLREDAGLNAPNPFLVHDPDPQVLPTPILQKD